MSQAIKNKDAFHPDQYCAHLDKVAAEFSRRFGELDIMEDITTFVSNPFQSTDVEKVSAKFEQVFGLQSGVDMDIIDLQNDIELKSRSRDSDFWGLVSREKFPLLTACALKVNAYFGSTYLCEMAFSQMKIIKSKYILSIGAASLMLTSQTASDWLSAAMNQTTKNLQTVFSHNHHTDLIGH